jgi:hypothetical protein
LLYQSKPVISITDLKNNENYLALKFCNLNAPKFGAIIE